MSNNNTSSYNRQPMPENAPTVGYHLVHGQADPATQFYDANMGADHYELVRGIEPYIPPIVEDESIPDAFDPKDGEELVDNGGIPYKRRRVDVPGLLDIEEEGTRDFNFHDGSVNVDFEVPEVNWGMYQLVNNVGLSHFFRATVSGSNFFTEVYGPFDGFENRMSTVEFNVNQREYKFDKARSIIPFVAYALACSALWAKHHIEEVKPERGPGLYYKAMVNMHCVFTKEYTSNFPNGHKERDRAPEKEYRRFIFDKMCEADDGTYLQARTDERLFKIVYNSFLQLCYEKLDDNNISRQPDIDSRFFFYALRTVCVTVFQYEPLAIGAFIPLESKFSKSRCVLNPKVEEDCFRYAVLLGILANEPNFGNYRASTLTEKSVMDVIFQGNGITADFSNLDEGLFLYNEKDLDKFCERNPNLFLTIWVEAENKEDRVPLHPIYQTPTLLENRIQINLLLLTEREVFNDEDEPALGYVDDLVNADRPLVNHHFACITNIDGLFYSVSGDHGIHVCPVCKVRRGRKNRALGFCKLHEPVEYQMAVSNLYATHGAVKVAVKGNTANYQIIMSTLCPKCANSFPNSAALKSHMEECLIKDRNYRVINLPKQREFLELSGKDRIKLSMLHTFMVADFESVLQPLDSTIGNQYFKNTHIPCSYSLVMESDYPQLCRFRCHIGTSAEETIKDFCDTIIQWSTEAHNFYRTNLPMCDLTPHENEVHALSKTCYICGKVFTKANGSRKVRDHDHLTGIYLGAACEGCNINRRPDRMYIPLFFHNGKNYDTHLLIKEITKAEYDCKFEGIAQNSQKIMSFKISKFTNSEKPDGYIETVRSMCDIKVLDSILFLLSSLSKLTEVQKGKSKWNGDPRTEEQLRGYEDVFPITYKWMKRIYKVPADTYDLRITDALRKNMYPYLWFTDFGKFKLPISELTKLFDEERLECFTENVTDAFTENFKGNTRLYHRIIDSFGFKTVEDYARLYVCMDTLQLADILQETRKVYQRVHRLDMFQFYGLPGYTWAAFQYHLGNSPYRPQLFMEGEMDKVCFIARAIRGGCSDSMLRYSKVNNPHMEFPKDYDPERPNTYLLYLDANNLYGWAMSQDLPYGDFQWMDSDSIERINTLECGFQILNDKLFSQLGHGFGAFIMCDLEFPPEIHDKMNWYPLAPVSGTVPEEWISTLSRQMHDIALTKHDPKSRLLLQTLTKRTEYVVYYKNLLFYLKHGMKLTRVYKILIFREFPLMKSYIDTNTRMRNQASSTAEKNQWKNANNSAYGKTFENQLNYSTLKFISGEKAYNNALKDPGFDGYAFISDNLMLAKMKNHSLTFNKPIYLGATITELAKLRMFYFYYDVLQDYFGEGNMRLCMTDTDSLLVEVSCPDVYKAIAEIQQRYDCPLDTSPLSQILINEYGIEGRHNKEVGYFKFEADPCAIQEFVGLRPKVYSAREIDDPVAHMRCKGTPHDSMERFVRHEDYIRCLFHNYAAENMRQNVDVDMIRAKDHDIFSIKSSKVSLSCNDSKRYILRDNVTTLAYGHYAIPQYERMYEKGEVIDEAVEYVSPLIKGIPEMENNAEADDVIDEIF